MTRVNTERFRRERARELEQLSELLLRHEVVVDSSPVQRASVLCRRDDAGTDMWAYSLDRLVFRPTFVPRALRPVGAREFTHVLSVNLKGPCVEDSYVGDPFTLLEMNIETRAMLSGRELYASWHLDRDLPSPTSTVREAHPLYHFQFGGSFMMNMIDAATASFGDLLLLAGPRLAHPPLDGVLAVDFFLSHYDPEKRTKLLGVREYTHLLTRIQERVWKAYANVSASRWAAVACDGSWTSPHLWPQLL
jgi:hypothetical protein